MRKGHIGLFRDEFLERRDRGFVIVFVEGGLRLVEEVVQRIAQFLRSGLGGFGRRVLRRFSRWGADERKGQPSGHQK
jgi:hypothetical protein